jgi:hypothetical protein
MPPTLLDTLKARYRFHEWQRAGEGAEQLFVKNYRVLGDELPNPFIKSRIARLGPALSSQPAALTMSSVIAPPPVVRLNTSTWKSMSAAGGRPLVVDVFEYPCRERALEALLELTAQFHQPVDLRISTDDIGEVSIATPDGGWFAFTRGNLLVRVVSGPGIGDPAKVVAQLIDDGLMAKPAATVKTVAEAIPGKVEKKGTASARAALFAIAAMDETFADQSEEDKPFIKVFSKGGTVALDRDLVIVPESAETEVEIFAMEPEGQWTRVRFEGSETPDVDANV